MTTIITTHRVWLARAAVTLIALAAAAVITGTGTARADDDDTNTTQTVCTGFNLGMSPDQIAQGLQRNDGRYNYWRAQQATIWPIISGDCG